MMKSDEKGSFWPAPRNSRFSEQGEKDVVRFVGFGFTSFRDYQKVTDVICNNVGKYVQWTTATSNHVFAQMPWQ